MKTLSQINEIQNFDVLCETYVELLNERNEIKNSNLPTDASFCEYPECERLDRIRDLLDFIKIKMKQIMTMNFDTLPF